LQFYDVIAQLYVVVPENATLRALQKIIATQGRFIFATFVGHLVANLSAASTAKQPSPIVFYDVK
jgi:hypothetical protein